MKEFYKTEQLKSNEYLTFIIVERGEGKRKEKYERIIKTLQSRKIKRR